MLSARSAVLADYFGTDHLQMITAVAMLLTAVGSTVGPLVMALLSDITGSFDVGLVFSIAAALFAIPLFFVARLLRPTAAAAIRDVHFPSP